MQPQTGHVGFLLDVDQQSKLVRVPLNAIQ